MNDSAHKTQLAILLHLRKLQEMANDGNAEAVRYLIDTAVTSTMMIFALKHKPDFDPSRAALESHAVNCDVWPVLVPAAEDMRAEAVKNQTPAMLGEKLNYRNKQAMRRDGKGLTRPRNFHPHSRTGFGKHVWAQLEKARHWSAIYPTAQEFIETELGRIVLLGDDSPQPPQEWLEFTLAEGWVYVWDESKKLKAASSKTIKSWVDAGANWADAVWSHQGESYDWPPELITNAKSSPACKKYGMERALRDEVRKWLNSESSGFTQVFPK
jgi:hypothetical protein